MAVVDSAKWSGFMGLLFWVSMANISIGNISIGSSPGEVHLRMRTTIRRSKGILWGGLKFCKSPALLGGYGAIARTL